jgi:hypothetical protein
MYPYLHSLLSERLNCQITEGTKTLATVPVCSLSSYRTVDRTAQCRYIAITGPTGQTSLLKEFSDLFQLRLRPQRRDGRGHLHNGTGIFPV